MIGTLAAAERTDPVLAVSGDRDLMQIVRDEPVPVRLLYVGRGLAKAELLGPGGGRREVRGAGAPGRARPTPRWRCCAATPPTGCPASPASAPRPRPRWSGRFGSWTELCAAVHRPLRHAGSPRRCAPSWPPRPPYLAVVEPVVRVALDAPVQLDRPDALPPAPADPTGLAALTERWGLGGSVDRLEGARTQGRYVASRRFGPDRPPRAELVTGLEVRPAPRHAAAVANAASARASAAGRPRRPPAGRRRAPTGRRSPR